MAAVATCGLVIVACQVLGDVSPQHSRVLEGVLTGIGFLGAGTIVKQGSTVHGTATAVSILDTAIPVQRSATACSTSLSCWP